MKRFLALLLCVVMAVSLLAACGSTQDSETGDKANDSGQGVDSNSGTESDESTPGTTPEDTPDTTPEEAEPDPRPDLSYEGIVEAMSHGLTGSRSERMGSFSYLPWTNSEHEGRADIDLDDPVTGKLEIPSYVEVSSDNFYPVTVFSLETQEVQGITDITFPKYIISISRRERLEQTAWYQSLPDGPVYIGRAFYGYKGEMPENYDLVVEDGTKIVMDYALEDQENLRSVTLPDSVIYIGDYAFSGCISLWHINMSRGLMWVGEYIIHNCQTLMDLFLPATLIHSGYSPFSGARPAFTVWYEGEKGSFSTEWRNANVSYGCTYEQYAGQTPPVPEDVSGLSNLANIPVGGIVIFGSYEQDNDTSNGPEKLRWRVMSKDGEYALLITESIIDSVPYFTDETKFINADAVVNNMGFDTRTDKYGVVDLIVTWDKSDIRSWLNGEFYDAAFTDEEKAQIVENETVTPTVSDNDPGCPTTYDMVFIPTWKPANKKSTPSEKTFNKEQR